jgi:hypothetical protein
MFAYELHKFRSADLIREADAHRLAREALRRRRESTGTPERRAGTPSTRRNRSGFARAA